MDFIKHIPDELKEWASKLSEKNLASILTHVGYAYLGISQNDNKKIEHLDKEKSSANIGIIGEKEVEKMLEERYNVENTAKTGKCADLLVTLNGVRVLVEVKKYSSSVPTKEIEKFYRDMDANSSINGGVMISLTSKITGISKMMEYKHININGNSIPVVFISLCNIPYQVTKECIYASIHTIICEVDSRSKYIDIDDNIAHAVNNIDNNLDYLSQTRLIIHETQDIITKQFTKLTHQVLSAEINIKSSMERLKSKVNVMEIENVSSTFEETQKLIASFNLNKELSNLLSVVIKKLDCELFKTKNIIHTEDKKISIKLTKTSIKVTIKCVLQNTIVIKDQWSYNGKELTVLLTCNSIDTVISLI
jgi:hypothetical protein